MKKYLLLSAFAILPILSLSSANAASYGITVEGAYAMSTVDKDKGGVDLYGGLLSLDMYTGKHDQLFIQAGYFSGEDTFSLDGSSTKFNREQIPVYIGYNYNYQMSNRITAYVGAKAGMASTDVERHMDEEKLSDSDAPFSYAIGGGLKFKLYSSWQFVVGYEYSRTYEKYTFYKEEVKDNQSYHIIKAGLSCTF